MEDLIKSIKAHLYERTTSPLFGTFSISWAIWNYKFLVVLASSMDANEKFNYISTFLYPNVSTCMLEGIAFPLLTTLAFIFIYPYPAKFVYEFTKNRQKELKRIKQEIEDETPLTIEESRKVRREMAMLEIEFGNEIIRKDSEIQRLKELVNEIKQQNHVDSQTETTEEKPSPEPLQDKPLENIDSEKLDLLLLISMYDNPYEKDIVGRSKTSKVKTEFNLGELENMNLVKSHSSLQGKYYSITHKGRTLLIKEGRVE